MAKPRRSTVPTPQSSVSPERAVRLYRLVKLLAAGPQGREMLKRRLRLDVRGFYRDLELVRAAGIAVVFLEQRYRLDMALHEALARLPFPDPLLTLGEVRLLAKGRTAAHRKLKDQITQILQ
jgi:hypothetical protein